MPLTLLDGLQPTKAIGADIRYLRVGSSTWVLLMHTMCTQPDIFGPLFEHLDTAGVEVMAADPPGHGASTMSSVTYAAGYFTNVAQALLEVWALTDNGRLASLDRPRKVAQLIHETA